MRPFSKALAVAPSRPSRSTVALRRAPFAYRYVAGISISRCHIRKKLEIGCEFVFFFDQKSLNGRSYSRTSLRPEPVGKCRMFSRAMKRSINFTLRRVLCHASACEKWLAPEPRPPRRRLNLAHGPIRSMKLVHVAVAAIRAQHVPRRPNVIVTPGAAPARGMQPDRYPGAIARPFERRPRARRASSSAISTRE
jgi:hypothetical protein